MNENSYTISNSIGNHSEEHSRRSYIPFSAEKSLSNRNVVIYDCGDDRKHLNETAKPYIRQYNMKQIRNDRKKDYEKDYVSALENGTACYGTGEQKEKPFHHDVIQIGNRDTLGVTDQDFDVDYWRTLKKEKRFDDAAAYVKEHINSDENIPVAIEILKEVAEEVLQDKEKKYSNILIHGLIIHADEPNGTPHLDFRFSIFTDNETRGIPWRISDHKGLHKMGFETDKVTTALQKFRESINARVEQKMLEHGMVREVKNEHRKHLTTAQYEAEQRIKSAEKKAKEIIDNAMGFAENIQKNIEMEKIKTLIAKKQYQQRKIDLIDKVSNLDVLQKNVMDFMNSKPGKMAYEKYLDDGLQEVNSETNVILRDNQLSQNQLSKTSEKYEKTETMDAREELGIPINMTPLEAVRYAQLHMNDNLSESDRKRSSKKKGKVQIVQENDTQQEKRTLRKTNINKQSVVSEKQEIDFVSELKNNNSEKQEVRL